MKKRFARICLAAGVLLLTALAVLSHFAAVAREQERELMRFGMEDVAERVRRTADNLELVKQFSDAAMLAKARAFAQIVDGKPYIVTNQPQLIATAKLLDVDEVHISNEEGILFACVPASRAGLDMHMNDQTQAFLPALTDKSFELAQRPFSARQLLRRDIDGLFQFAGVARLDKPGIMQVGQRALRIEQALNLADVTEIARTARIGRHGRVSIALADDLPPPREGFVHGQDGGGADVIILESDCAGYRIAVSMPDYYPLLGNEWTFRILLFVDLVLVLIALLAGADFRRVFLEDIREVRELFADARQRTFLRTLTSPLLLACFVVFATATVLCWFVSMRTARVKAEDMLLAAAQDMRDTFESSVDQQLFHEGQAICRYYKDPTAITAGDAENLLARYGIDEINSVNAYGEVVAGTLTPVGYKMAANPNTAAFNCLLEGAATFSQPFRGAVENPLIRRKYVGVAFPPPAKGYIQIGFDEWRVKDDIDYWFADQARDLHIGETGFYVIAKDETGAIDSCGLLDGGAAGATLAGIGFDATSAPKSPDEFFVANLFGRDCLCLTEVKSFHRIVTAMPLAEVNGASRRLVLTVALVLFVLLVLVGVFMTHLSDLVTKLRGFIDADKRRQLKDLALAKTIQTSALPFVFPVEADFKIFAKMVTAREVGGDFYDFYPRPDGKLIFLVADVSGKGIPAALFMMRAKAIIRAAVLESPESISGAIGIANDNLAEHNEAEMFVTAWVGVYDRATGEIAFVNAGHNPPLIRRADGSVEWVRNRGGLVLAAMNGIKYRSGRCRLGPGDSLFLYTDGVTEAMNRHGEQYGEARLEAALKRVGKTFVSEIGEDIAAFTAGAEQSDDITMLALDRLLV